MKKIERQEMEMMKRKAELQCEAEKVEQQLIKLDGTQLDRDNRKGIVDVYEPEIKNGKVWGRIEKYDYKTIINASRINSKGIKETFDYKKRDLGYGTPYIRGYYYHEEKDGTWHTSIDSTYNVEDKFTSKIGKREMMKKAAKLHSEALRMLDQLGKLDGTKADQNKEKNVVDIRKPNMKTGNVLGYLSDDDYDVTMDAQRIDKNGQKEFFHYEMSDSGYGPGCVEVNYVKELKNEKKEYKNMYWGDGEGGSLTSYDESDGVRIRGNSANKPLYVNPFYEEADIEIKETNNSSIITVKPKGR